MVEPTPLATVLQEQGRTQTWLAIQLSARLGRAVYKQEVSRWALGAMLPEDRTQRAIASVLDVPVADLFGIHADTVSTTPTSIRPAGSDEEIAA
jgi:transcriptional regulator with XRE-family HTH domain